MGPKIAFHCQRKVKGFVGQMADIFGLDPSKVGESYVEFIKAGVEDKSKTYG